MARRKTPVDDGTDAKRAIIRLKLDVADKQALDDLCHRRGVTQISVMSRAVSWFCRQDEVIQASVLGLMSAERLAGLSKARLGREKPEGR